MAVAVDVVAEGDSGWQTVISSAHNRVDHMEKAQREAYERQAIDAWATLDGNWSGIGKHLTDVVEAKKLHGKIKQAVVQELGFGGQGVVQKFSYTHKGRSVSFARKRLVNRRGNIALLREEANVLERLSHDHIVRLVGTYSYHQRELYLVLWPAAACDLSHLLNDLDDLRFNGGDRSDILERLSLLDLHEPTAFNESHRSPGTTPPSDKCPLDYLRRIMGCVTRAVDYCHAARVRHLDLKPSNILLSSGRVYLCDFGISRDVHDLDHTKTGLEQGTVKWMSPERLNCQDEWSMQAADVYGLGLVFLSIATCLYGARQVHLFDVLEQSVRQLRLQQMDVYIDELLKLALITQDFADESALTFAPKHVVSLTRRMLAPDPANRPHTTQVNEELVTLGGLDQIYHSVCCRVSSRVLSQLMDRNYALIKDEHRRLIDVNEKMHRENEQMKKRLEVLEGREEMYDMRIKNERKSHAKDRENLVKQLEEERQSRKRTEEQHSQNNVGYGRPHHGHSHSHSYSYSHPQSHPHSRPLHHQRNPTPGSPPIERRTSGLLTMKPVPPRLAGCHKPPMQPIANGDATITAPSVKSPTPHHDPPKADSEGAKPPEIPLTYALRSRASGSRLPQPVNPSTPIRSVTPNHNTSSPRDPNLTDSTTDSATSSLFSRPSRRTTTVTMITPGISPVTADPSPGSSRILDPADKPTSLPQDVTTVQDPERAMRLSASAVRQLDMVENRRTGGPHPPDTPASTTVPPSVASDSVYALGNSSVPADVVSQHGTDISESVSAPGARKMPALPIEKSWAAVAGDTQGLAGMIGSVPSGRRKYIK